MVRTLPPLNALRVFEVAARHESFSSAARELNISHSAISRHVRGLEERLGVRLFREMPRGVALTMDGRAYLARLTPALDAISTATEALTEAPSGRITVNAEPLFAHRLMIPLLPEFAELHPEIELRLEASHDLADVERFEADLAIRFFHSGVPDMPSDLLSDAPVCVCAVPALAEQIQKPSDVLKFRLLKDRGAPVWNLWLTEQGVPNPPPDTGWRLRPQLAFEAALHGYGVFMGSRECLGPDLDTGRLVLLYETSLRHGAFHLVYGSRGPRGKAANTFRRWLIEKTAGFRTNGKDQPTG